MFFCVKKEYFLYSLKKVSGAVERNRKLKNYSKINISLLKDKLFIVSKSFEIEIISFINLEIDNFDNGSFSIDFQKIFNICKFASCVIEFNLKGNRLVIKSGNSVYTVSVLPSNDFFYFNNSKDELNFLVQSKNFKFLLNKISFLILKEDIRSFLRGMFFEIKDSFLNVVATDGHRMGVDYLKLNYKTNIIKKILVPRSCIIELLKILDNNGYIMMSIHDDIIKFTAKNFILVSKLLKESFPCYKQIICNESKNKVTANRLALKDFFIRSSIILDNKKHGVKIKLNKNIIEIYANNSKDDIVKETLGINYNGFPLELGINAYYIIDCLDSMYSEAVNLFFFSCDKWIILKGINDSCIYVVMPMKI